MVEFVKVGHGVVVLKAKGAKGGENEDTRAGGTEGSLEACAWIVRVWGLCFALRIE